MIVALQTLVLCRQSLVTIFQRFFCPYYRQLSLAFIGGKDGEEEDEEDEVFADYDDERGVVFYPPMYVQRYAAVTDCLVDEQWAGKLQKVVDLGCHDLSFVKYLKDLPGVNYILGVDIESISLRCSSELLASDSYAYKRDTPPRITLFQGNAADPDYRLIGCDAVVAIEMIEHMLPHDLERLVHNVFGFIKPWIAIFTTPNADFNVLFKNLEQNGLRRMDHLFEWSREQFHDWCSNIVSRYPQYTVHCKGIGPGPPDTQHLGCCSQMALFVNKHYQKQKDLDPNSLALVEKIPSPCDIQEKIGWDCSDPDLPDNILALTDQVDSQKILYSEPSCITIILSKSSYCVKELTYRDSTSQCNLDRELGRNYMMFDHDETSQLLVPSRLLNQNCYVMEDVFRRLNCSTSQATKFSKSTQMLMARNDVNTLGQTRDVVEQVRHLIENLNFNKGDLEDRKDNGHIWYNINWGENAPYWNNYYKVVKEYNYPFQTESDETRILDLISAEINRLIDSQYDEEFSVDVYKLEIPISHLMNVVRHITHDFDHVKDLLEWNGYEIVNDTVVHSRKVLDCPSIGSRDEWDEDDAHSDWENAEVISTTSEANHLRNGRCLRQALNKKVRDLLSMRSADVDIAAELDAVICRLVRLALWACKERQQPPPYRWMQCKLLDLLALREKAIARRGDHQLEQGFTAKAIAYVPGADEISRYIDDSSARQIQSRYRSLCCSPVPGADEISRYIDDSSARQIQSRYRSLCCSPEHSQTNRFQDDLHGYIFQTSSYHISVAGEPKGVIENINVTESQNNVFKDLKRTHDWLEKERRSPDRISVYSYEKNAKRSRLLFYDNSDYSYTDSSPTRKAGLNVDLEEDTKTKTKFHKTKHSRPQDQKRSSFKSNHMLEGKDTDAGINDVLNSKRRNTRLKKMQSTPSKPIPGSIIELCHHDLSTQNNKDGLKRFGNITQPMNLPDSSVSATKESVLIDIIMDEMEETIALRRTIGTDVDDDQTVQEQESILASIVHTHENELSPMNSHSQTIFLYDLNEPSTSKGVRHTSMDVQCGPDASTPAYVMLSPASSIAVMPTTQATGTNIEESIAELSIEINAFDSYTNVNHYGPVCRRTVSPNVFQKGIKIVGSEIDVPENKPQNNECDPGTVTVIEEYEHGTVFIMPTFRKADVIDASPNESPIHQSLYEKTKDMNTDTYKEVDKRHSKDEEKSKSFGFYISEVDEKIIYAKSDACEYGAQINEESKDVSSCISRKQAHPVTWIDNKIHVILQDDCRKFCTRQACRSLSSSILSNLSEPTIDMKLLKLIPNCFENQNSIPDICRIVTSLSKRCRRPNLICGGINTHSYKDKHESEDVMYQGIWQKNLTRVRKASDHIMISRSTPQSPRKPKCIKSKNAKDMNLKIKSRIPKLSINLENQKKTDSTFRRKSASPLKSKNITPLSIRRLSSNPMIVAFGTKSVRPATLNAKEIKNRRDIAMRKPVSVKRNDPGKKEMQVRNTFRERHTSMMVKNKTESMKLSDMTFRSSESPMVTEKKYTTVSSPILTENSNNAVASPTRPRKSVITFKEPLSQTITKMSTTREPVSPKMTKNSDSKKLSDMTSIKIANPPMTVKSNSPNNIHNKTVETLISDTPKIQPERKPEVIKYPSPIRPIREPAKVEMAKQTKTISKRKKSCTKISSGITISVMSSKIKRPKSSDKTNRKIPSTKSPLVMPASKTPNKECVVANKFSDKIKRNNYIPPYLKRLKILKNRNVAPAKVDSLTIVASNISSLIEYSSIKQNSESKNAKDFVKTHAQKTFDGECSEIEGMLKSRLMKEIFTVSDELIPTKKGISKFSTPTTARSNNYKNQNMDRKNIAHDLLKCNIVTDDVAYHIFRNELDNNVRSSTNCNTADSPRENAKKKSNRKLSPSSVTYDDSSCSSHDSVATVKMVLPKSTKRSTSSNRSSVANSESEQTTPTRTRKYTKRQKIKRPDKNLTDKENMPQSSKTCDKNKSKSDNNTLKGRKTNVYLTMAAETPIVDSFSVHHSQTATKSNVKMTMSKKSDEKNLLKTVSCIKSDDSAINYEIRNQESTSSRIADTVFLADSDNQEQNSQITNRPSVCTKPDSSLNVSKQSNEIEVLTANNESKTNDMQDTISSSMRGFIFDRLHLMSISSCELKANSDEAHEETSITDSLIPFESLLSNDESHWSDTSAPWDLAQGSGLKSNTKIVPPESDMNSLKSASDYYFAESELETTSLSGPAPVVDIISSNPDTPRADSVQDIFERKQPLTSPNQVSGLAAQAFSGFSMNAEPTSGDKPDYVNLIDSETGSVAADFHPRQTASEELMISGRSSDSFESCVIEEDSVIPSWLFEIIQQQAAAPIDQPPEFGPLPVVAVDANNNPTGPVVRVTAGAGDGRGIHSDPSQDTTSSGLESSLSSSDTSSGQESVVSDASAEFGLFSQQQPDGSCSESDCGRLATAEASKPTLPRIDLVRTRDLPLSSDSSSGQESVALPLMDPFSYRQYEMLRNSNGSPAAANAVPTITIRNVDSPGNDSEILSTSRNAARRPRDHLLFSDVDADVSSLDTDVPDSS